MAYVRNSVPRRLRSRRGLGDASVCGSNPCGVADFLFPWSMGAPCAAYWACKVTGTPPPSDVASIPVLVPDVGQSGTPSSSGDVTPAGAPAAAPNYIPLVLTGAGVLFLLMLLRK